jgi:hypothetical protein
MSPEYSEYQPSPEQAEYLQTLNRGLENTPKNLNRIAIQQTINHRTGRQIIDFHVQPKHGQVAHLARVETTSTLHLSKLHPLLQTYELQTKIPPQVRIWTIAAITNLNAPELPSKWAGKVQIKQPRTIFSPAQKPPIARKTKGSSHRHNQKGEPTSHEDHNRYNNYDKLTELDLSKTSPSPEAHSPQAPTYIYSEEAVHSRTEAEYHRRLEQGERGGKKAYNKIAKAQGKIEREYGTPTFPNEDITSNSSPHGSLHSSANNNTIFVEGVQVDLNSSKVQ